MKALKLFAALALMFVGLAAQAQDEVDASFIFVDSLGNEITNGSTYTINRIDEVDDGFGDITRQIITGIKVRNTLAEEAAVGLEVTVNSVTGGALSVCFPETCHNYSTTGTFDNGSSVMAAGENRDLQTELILSEEQGESQVEMQLKKMAVTYNKWGIPSFTFESYGPKITLVFTTEATGNSLDVNGDGAVDAQDVTALIQAVLGETSGAGYDVNADGAIDASDITMLINAILGV